MSRPALILLAAGGSRRMGRPKQLIEFQGKPLILHALEQLYGTGESRCMVVLGAHFERIAPLLPSSIPIVRNTGWQSGMAGSIRMGITEAQKQWPDLDAVLICLADQPHLGTVHYQRILQAVAERPDQIIAARYGGKTGAPALFPARFFPELMALHGDEGAGKWLRSVPELVEAIDLPEAALDWDEPWDVESGE